MPTTPDRKYTMRPFDDAYIAFECADLTQRWTELNEVQKAEINAHINAVASGRQVESDPIAAAEIAVNRRRIASLINRVAALESRLDGEQVTS